MSKSFITPEKLIRVDRQGNVLEAAGGLRPSSELKMHLRAAFNNGVTRDELKELIMHSALYCGLPAANATMHLAQQVFDDIDAAQG